jgi:hypothetical protein
MQNPIYFEGNDDKLNPHDSFHRLNWIYESRDASRATFFVVITPKDQRNALRISGLSVAAFMGFRIKTLSAQWKFLLMLSALWRIIQLSADVQSIPHRNCGATANNRKMLLSNINSIEAILKHLLIYGRFNITANDSSSPKKLRADILETSFCGLFLSFDS